jgi:hypothetical protein
MMLSAFVLTYAKRAGKNPDAREPQLVKPLFRLAVYRY